MERHEFLSGMDRLRAVFGSQHYPNEKELAVASRLGHIPGEAWADVVDTLILSKRYAPTPIEIIEEVKIWLRAHPEALHRESPQREVDCTDCYETGWMPVSHDNFGRIMIYCSCGHGASMAKQNPQDLVPVWSSAFPSLGFTKLPFPIHKFKFEQRGEQQFSDPEAVSQAVLSRSGEFWEKVQEWKLIQKQTREKWSEINKAERGLGERV